MSSPLPRERTDTDLWVCRLGCVAYPEAVEIQQRIRRRRQEGEIPDTLLLLEHPPTYTRGRRSGDAELALGSDFYAARGIEVVETDRGGRVTYHAPGQLVGYPIMTVPDVGTHLRRIEAAIIATLGELGIDARSRCSEGPDYTGVWVAERKIASIGVHLSRGVSTHGFAVNVDLDLEPFSWVIACGLPDVAMTSVAAELARTGGPAQMGAAALRAGGDGLDPDAFRDQVAANFCAVHGRVAREVAFERLGVEPAVAA